MAKLNRFVKLNDRFQTQVFTFTLPNKVIREFTPDVHTKDFVYGYQKWTASFVKDGRHLGAYLKLHTSAPAMICRLDFSFTVLNRQHFTKNESFIERNCTFDSESTVQGLKTFIGLSDLVERGFMQDNGEFLVELELRNIVTTYESYLRLPKEYHQSRNPNSIRIESTYFSFGLFDWSVSLTPCANSSIETDGNVAVQLHRHTSFDHLCNIRYQITLGEEGTFQSGELSQLLEADGNGEPYIVGSSLYYLSRGRATIRVKVDMFSVVSISEVIVHALSRDKNRAHCYDKDKQAWMLESDTSGKYLAFKLYYTDISHVPRKYARYVCWDIDVIPRASSARPIKAMDSPYYRYYVQQELDDGYLIHTDIPVEELTDPDSHYLDPEDHKLTVHIDWIDSHLLVCPTYYSLDDVCRVHKHQMRREIMALQAENYALEKQLYSYQQSIAKTNSKSKSLEYDTEPTPADSRDTRWKVNTNDRTGRRAKSPRNRDVNRCDSR